jgi:hypothetical protein
MVNAFFSRVGIGIGKAGLECEEAAKHTACSALDEPATPAVDRGAPIRATASPITAPATNARGQRLRTLKG